jgi:hypothetical protein
MVWWKVRVARLTTRENVTIPMRAAHRESAEPAVVFVFFMPNN